MCYNETINSFMRYSIMYYNVPETLIQRIWELVKAVLFFCFFAVILFWIPSYAYAKSRRIQNGAGLYAAVFSIKAAIAILGGGISIVALFSAIQSVHEGGLFLFQMVIVVVLALFTVTVCQSTIVDTLFDLDPEENDGTGILLFAGCVVLECAAMQLISGVPIFTDLVVQAATIIKNAAH
ncbi:hypothetical protein RsoM2USA_377 [Ralstonia phage RsoM2USA]|nr:hypothetical protein RsoM2USA_377 [Ralstonia phage RsoM2USA]